MTIAPGPVVVNASPLIALNQIGHLQVLEQLFSTVLAPPAVRAEAKSVLQLPEWVQERPLTQPIGPRVLRASLGPGESEAIALAMEIGATRLILDDRPARRLAAALGLPLIGTVGVLLAAKRKGVIAEIAPLLTALTDRGFRVSADLCEKALADAGESP